MLTLQIQDDILKKQIADMLQNDFDGNPDKMLQELIKSYTAQLDRLNYSGILKWKQDGLMYQKETRGEW